MRAGNFFYRASPGRCAALALGCALLLGGCLTPPPRGVPASRVVLVWLKNPGSADDRAQVERAAQSLRMIPGVLRVETGRSVPAGGAEGRGDFDLGVVIIFRDRAALERYQQEPRYLAAMRRYLRPLVRRYEVYNLSGR